MKKSFYFLSLASLILVSETLVFGQVIIRDNNVKAPADAIRPRKLTNSYSVVTPILESAALTANQTFEPGRQNFTNPLDDAEKDCMAKNVAAFRKAIESKHVIDLIQWNKIDNVFFKLLDNRESAANVIFPPAPTTSSGGYSSQSAPATAQKKVQYPDIKLSYGVRVYGDPNMDIIAVINSAGQCLLPTDQDIEIALSNDPNGGLTTYVQGVVQQSAAAQYDSLTRTKSTQQQAAGYEQVGSGKASISAK